MLRAYWGPWYGLDGVRLGDPPPPSKSALCAEVEASAAAPTLSAGLSGAAWFGLELVSLCPSANDVECAGLSGADSVPTPVGSEWFASEPSQGLGVMASPMVVCGCAARLLRALDFPDTRSARSPPAHSAVRPPPHDRMGEFSLYRRVACQSHIWATGGEATEGRAATVAIRMCNTHCRSNLRLNPAFYS